MLYNMNIKLVCTSGLASLTRTKPALERQSLVSPCFPEKPADSFLKLAAIHLCESGRQIWRGRVNLLRKPRIRMSQSGEVWNLIFGRR